MAKNNTKTVAAVQNMLRAIGKPVTTPVTIGGKPPKAKQK
jgi:hypothetical protein